MLVVMRLCIRIGWASLSKTGRSRHGRGQAAVLVFVIHTVEALVWIVRLLRRTSTLTGWTESTAGLPVCVVEMVTVRRILPRCETRVMLEVTVLRRAATIARALLLLVLVLLLVL